jgi:primary-amine oxidase
MSLFTCASADLGQGDLPNTVFTTAHSGIQLMPSNYFETGTNVETVNRVRVNYDKGVVSDVISFGASAETCAMNYEPIFVDLWEYKGDVVVRKLPYSPSDPYYETDSI